MSYKSEFPDYDGEFINPGKPWQDTSYHNDECPSIGFTLFGHWVYIYQDYELPELREVPETPRYMVIVTDPEGETLEQLTMMSDDFKDCIDRANQIACKLITENYPLAD